MKNNLIFSLSFFLFMSLGSTVLAQNQLAFKETHSVMIEENTIVWDSKTINLGPIEKGNPTEGTFEFTNQTNTPIVIAKVKSSCGCTVTNYERKAILPGEKASVTATYDAKKSGNFRKNITVMLSDDSKHLLVLKGQVASEAVIVAK